MAIVQTLADQFRIDVLNGVHVLSTDTPEDGPLFHCKWGQP